MIHRTGDKIIVQDMTEQATRSKWEATMAIEGSNIMSQKANGKAVNYFTCAFKIKSAEVYETDKRERLELPEIQTLSPIARLTGTEFVKIPNTKDGKHWLILVCHIDLEV